jgi:glutathione S-transferase
MGVIDLHSGVELHREHAFVLLSLVFVILTHSMWMSFQVGAARKKYKVNYPNLYADKSNPSADAFNCVQRGHQNSLENLPVFLSLLLVAGFRFPITAAVAGVVYNVGRIFYFRGYATGKPAQRQRGSFMYFGTLTLLGSIIYWAFLLLTGRT